MTINRSLYIVTEQVKQEADHDKISVFFAGLNPREANHAFAARANNSCKYLFHRVNLNNMGANDVEEISYSDLVSAARSFSAVDAAEDIEETRL